MENQAYVSLLLIYHNTLFCKIFQIPIPYLHSFTFPKPEERLGTTEAGLPWTNSASTYQKIVFAVVFTPLERCKGLREVKCSFYKEKSRLSIKSWRKGQLLKMSQSCHFLTNLAIFSMQNLKMSQKAIDTYSWCLKKLLFRGYDKIPFSSLTSAALQRELRRVAHWKSYTSYHLDLPEADGQHRTKSESMEEPWRNILIPWYPLNHESRWWEHSKQAPKSYPLKSVIVTVVSFSS